MILWLGFIICCAVIVYSGSKLSKYGDIIAEKTGLSRTWTGVVLIATVTSLPELVTGISSVTYAGVPDIAVGNVLGACLLNMLIFAILDIFHQHIPLSAKAHHGHILSAGFVTLLLGIVAIGLFLANLVSKAILATATVQAKLLALSARLAIIFLAGAMALRQMGLANEIINLAFGLLFGAIAVAVAIALGLGGREIAARELEEWIKSIKSKQSQ